MANLKEIRTRIASVSSTKQITSAMKMVAAAKLRRAQDAILQLRPYANKLSEILAAISETLRQDEDNLFLKEREVKKVLIVVITSNKGLCGAFNTSVIKRVTGLVKEKYRELNSVNGVELLIIGRKANDHFRRRNYTIIACKDELLDDLNYQNVADLSDELVSKFVKGDYDRIELVYNQFINAAVQRLVEEQYLPVSVPEPEEEKIKSTYVDYIFEPSKAYIVREIIPKSLKLQLFKALLDSNASEQGARMTAMHKATDNAAELLKELKLDYNKARQASITNEILEIVSGANALGG